MRIAHGQPPAATGMLDGLAWARFDPQGPPGGTVVILHGAGSRKESHHDFAQCCSAGGLQAMTFDARGHGASEGALGAGAVDDVVAMAALAREHCGGGPLALRGSSMGGYFALVAAARCAAEAVVAICPASGQGLANAVADGRADFRADRDALAGVLQAEDVHDATAALDAPLLLLHARGDEVVPVEHSQELARAARRCRYVELPGGHHRSIQHDPELQGVAARFIRRAFAGRE